MTTEEIVGTLRALLAQSKGCHEPNGPMAVADVTRQRWDAIEAAARIVERWGDARGLATYLLNDGDSDSCQCEQCQAARRVLEVEVK